MSIALACVVGHIVGRVKPSTHLMVVTRHLTMWIVFVFVLTLGGRCVTRVGMAWLGRDGESVGPRLRGLDGDLSGFEDARGMWVAVRGLRAL